MPRGYQGHHHQHAPARQDTQYYRIFRADDYAGFFGFMRLGPAGTQYVDTSLDKSQGWQTEPVAYQSRQRITSPPAGIITQPTALPPSRQPQKGDKSRHKPPWRHGHTSKRNFNHANNRHRVHPRRPWGKRRAK